MNLTSVSHRPMSEDAFALSDHEYIFRLKTQKGDFKSVEFSYGDRASMSPKISFTTLSMKKVRSDIYFDYFEIKLDTKFERVAYYFTLNDGNETIYYYGDCFEKTKDARNSDYFQLPFNHFADRVVVPEWTKEAVVYNIFPDSFASGKNTISCESEETYYNGTKICSKLGGTINGISENLEYIKNLGCNCIYLNPFFTADSYHKYDLLDYYHVDPLRGSDDDFKSLVIKAHSMGIKVIIDGVFNHISMNHLFFRDVLENGKNSQYYDYFYDLGSDKPVVPKPGDMPKYTCFAYVAQMPKTNTSNKDLCEYFCSVGEYWIKEFDVDGWRLDVANELNDEFLRSFRNRVIAAKNDVIVIGEVWENASHYVNHKLMDGAMNYDFRRFVSAFIATGENDAAEYDVRVSRLLYRYPAQSVHAQLNLLDSHDVSRFLSLCKGDVSKMELAILLQMTFIGMPCIFYGDENALMGIEEDEYRRPMNFDKSSELYEVYKKLIKLRKDYPSLRGRDYETILVKDRTYGYKRGNICVILNAGEKELAVDLEGKNVILSKNLTGSSIDAGGYVVFE